MDAGAFNYGSRLLLIRHSRFLEVVGIMSITSASADPLNTDVCKRCSHSDFRAAAAAAAKS